MFLIFYGISGVKSGGLDFGLRQGEHLTSLTPGLTVTILPPAVNKYLLLLQNRTVATTLYC